MHDAGEAAQALQNLVHGAAPLLFGAGLFGASMLGAAAVPLTTAYAVTEAFGWERGLDHRFREAPIFFGLLTGILVVGRGDRPAHPAGPAIPLISSRR